MQLINDGHPFLFNQAGDVGLTGRQVTSAHAAGRLRRVIHRVYVDADADDTRAARLRALRLVMPAGGVLADEWAAWVYGVDVFTPTQRHQLIPTALVQHGTSRLRVDGVRCRQAELKDAADVDFLDGVHVTTPLRTASDLLRKKWRPHAFSAVDAMAHAGLVVPDELRHFVARLRGYPGIVQARSLSEWIDPGSQSPGESWTRLRLLDAGFPTPQTQWGVVDVDGVQRWLDLADPERMIAIEYDGREFHTGRRDVEHDGYRRASIGARGYVFVVARRDTVFGSDPAFEREVGSLMGMNPLTRRW